MQRLPLKASFLMFLAVLLSGCASQPEALSPEEAFTRNVLFTIPLDSAGSPSQVSSSFAATGQSTGSQNLIQAVLKFHGLTKVSQFSLQTLNVEAVVADIGPEKELQDVVNALSRDQRVESVQTVKPFKLMAYNDPYFELQATVNGDHIDAIHRSSTGKNVTVGIIDTGVDRQHPELVDRIVYTRNLVTHDQEAFDMDEHGTAVAGIIASAANNDVGIVGVAPDVQLMVFKACHQEASTRRTSCDSVSIIKALGDVLVQQPDILNLSLSGPADGVIARLLHRAYEQGMILVAAVDESVGEQGSFPANLPEVIPVGTAISELEDVGWALRAPGTDMLTTAPGSTYGFKSGSSIASAYVSGIVALMKEREPGLSADQARDYLKTTSRSDDSNRAVVDMCAALRETAGTQVQCGPMPAIAQSAP
ncbi:MAG: S8 family serine peptidase [Pseudomonadales bacterium]|nr:S8 family serine peptidase [Pseudomonadales bacterium]MBO7007849.1 S8 family serine peptidase [Pseudomonadales bacterium]